MMVCMDAQDAWERLARLVRDRREREGWTQLDVVTRGGPSLDRLQAIEASRNTRYSPRTLSKLERALGWEAGSVREVLTGGEPTIAESVGRPPRESADKIAADVNADLAEIGDMLQQMLERKRGRPLTENQRRVTVEWADTLERTIDAMDEETG